MNRKGEGPRLLCPPPVQSPVVTSSVWGHMLGAAHQHGSCGRGWVPCGVARQAQGHSSDKALQVHLQACLWALSWAATPLFSQAPTGAWLRAGDYQIFGEVDKSLNMCWLRNERGNAAKGLITQPAWALSSCPTYASFMAVLGYNPPPTPTTFPHPTPPF